MGIVRFAQVTDRRLRIKCSVLHQTIGKIVSKLILGQILDRLRLFLKIRQHLAHLGMICQFRFDVLPLTGRQLVVEKGRNQFFRKRGVGHDSKKTGLSEKKC